MLISLTKEMADKPITTRSSLNQPFQPRAQSSATRQGARLSVSTPPNAISPAARPTFLSGEDNPALKIPKTRTEPIDSSANSYCGGDPFEFPKAEKNFARHPHPDPTSSSDPATSMTPIRTAPVPEEHRRLSVCANPGPGYSNRLQAPFMKTGKQSRESLKSAGARLVSHQPALDYNPIAHPAGPSPHSREVPRNVHHDESLKCFQSTIRPNISQSHPPPYRLDIQMHPSGLVAPPTSVSRGSSSPAQGRYNVRKPGLPELHQRGGCTRKQGHPKQSLGEKTQDAHYFQPERPISYPPIKGVIDGTISIVANEKASILSSNLASKFRPSDNCDNGIIAPFSDSKPSKLSSAPLPRSQFSPQSKLPGDVKNVPPQPQKTHIPSPKGNTNRSVVRHPESFSDPNSIPDIPRKGQTSRRSTEYKFGNSSKFGQQISSPAFVYKNHNSVTPPHSTPLEPVNSIVLRPEKAAVNIEEILDRPATNQNQKWVKQVPSSNGGKAACKSNASHRDALRHKRRAQVVDVDSVEVGNENSEVVESGGGGKVRTRLESTAEPEICGTVRRAKKVRPVSLPAEKAEGEAWMNKNPDKKQFLSVLRNAFDKHPNIISLSHFSLSDADLRVIFEQPLPHGCDEVDRAFELDNNRITGLTSFVCKKLAEFRVDRLNLAFNNLRQIQGHIVVCKKLRFLNLSRNELESLPDELSQLDALETFNVSHNDLRKLPEKMFCLRKLEILIVAHNNLEGLPTDLVDCGSKLFAVDISHNVDIRVLPDCLRLCKNLANLELAGTGLRESLRPKDMLNNVFSLASTIAGRSEQDLSFRKKEGKFPPVVTEIATPPRERAGRAAIEREESKKSALRSKEANEVEEVLNVDAG